MRYFMVMCDTFWWNKGAIIVNRYPCSDYGLLDPDKGARVPEGRTAQIVPGTVLNPVNKKFFREILPVDEKTVDFTPTQVAFAVRALAAKREEKLNKQPAVICQ